MMSDHELVLLLRKKDEEAFRKLFLDYKESVYNTALNILQNEHDASDILQEVFVEIYVSIGSFKEKSSLSTWIYRICVTKSLMLLRKHKRSKLFLFFGHSHIDANQKSLTNWVHPGVIAEHKETARILYHAISQLPEKQRIPFTLFHINGLSQNQIAEITNQSISAVETQIFRSKQKLAMMIKNEEGER